MLTACADALLPAPNAPAGQRKSVILLPVPCTGLTAAPQALGASCQLTPWRVPCRPHTACLWPATQALPSSHPRRCEPPPPVEFIGPCAAGKTLLARAVANRTDACFIRVIGSELVQKYVGEGARMVRDLFQMARTKKACVIFFDEVDAIGGARFDDGAGEWISSPSYSPPTSQSACLQQPHQVCGDRV